MTKDHQEALEKMHIIFGFYVDDMTTKEVREFIDSYNLVKQALEKSGAEIAELKEKLEQWELRFARAYFDCETTTVDEAIKAECAWAELVKKEKQKNKKLKEELNDTKLNLVYEQGKYDGRKCVKEQLEQENKKLREQLGE